MPRVPTGIARDRYRRAYRLDCVGLARPTSAATCSPSSPSIASAFFPGSAAWDDVSPTITSGCSNPSKGRFLHPEEDRAITLREASILQGFPPTYKFDAKLGKETLALMIGNALPPPFIRQQARALL